MQIQIDHVTVCGSELRALQQEFSHLRFATDYGGPHANGITQMALLGFEDGSYLELIAPIKHDDVEASPWADLMLGDAGAGAWAMATTDIHAETARLKSLGIQTAGPKAGSRRRPDGRVIEWEAASSGPGAMGTLLPFLIQDHTPREWRVQTSASVKGSGIGGIARVVLGVKDLEAATALFRRAYTWDEPLVEDHSEFGAKVAHFPGSLVMLASPLTQNSWLASRLSKFGEIPAAFLLGTNDVDQTAKRFHVTATQNWFGRTTKWFEPGKFSAIRLGLLQN